MLSPGSFAIFVMLAYVLLAIIILIICRWVFAIDKRVKQNQSMINLLTLLAKKQGATDDEIQSSITR